MITALRALTPADVSTQLFRSGEPVPRPVERDDLLSLTASIGQLPDLAAALEPGGPRIALAAGFDGGWPAPDDLESLVAGGVIELALTLPSELAADDWVHLVSLLVAAREHGLPVTWPLPANRPVWAGVELLHHLPPPTVGDAATVRRWTREYRYGQLFWRRGPGFVTVVDARSDARIRYVIDEAPLLELFEFLVRPRRVEALPDDLRERLAELLDADLAVVGDGLAARLPYRLRHWPMPGHQL